MTKKFPLVKFDFSAVPVQQHKLYKIFKNRTFILIGEIEQLLGHCILIDNRSGQVLSGFHTENFVKLTSDET